MLCPLHPAALHSALVPPRRRALAAWRARYQLAEVLYNACSKVVPR